MITLITGVPGSGKSLFALKYIHDLAKKEKRQVYYYNIPELTLDWKQLDDPEKWYECPPGSIVVIDEAQNWWRPRSPSVKPPLHVSNLEIHRQTFSIDLFFITQDPMLVDGNLRKLTSRHFHVERFYGFPKATIHEFTKCVDNVSKSTKGSMQTHFVYPKEVYSWYKSADVHTVKKRLPMRLFMIVALPLVLLYLLYTGYKTIEGVAKSKELEQQSIADKVDTNKGSLPASAPPVDYSHEYLRVRAPVVADLPQSAEIYKEAVKPITVPYAAACLASKNDCRCYTQQATKITVSDTVCRQIALNGQFIDFDTSPRKQKQNIQAVPVHNAESSPNAEMMPVSVLSGNGIIKGEALDAEPAPRHVNLNLPSQDASLRYPY